MNSRSIFVLALALFGCATPGTSNRREITDLSPYWPLAVGNEWIYERSYLGEKGEERIAIVRREDGAFVDNRGNQVQVDAFGIRDAKRYLLRHPVESGREWTTIVSVSSMERNKILDSGFTCEAPAGTFEECVRVESKNRIRADEVLVNETTFAPGVGIVRVAVFLDTKGKRVPQAVLTLKSFSLKHAPVAAKSR